MINLFFIFSYTIKFLLGLSLTETPRCPYYKVSRFYPKYEIEIKINNYSLDMNVIKIDRSWFTTELFILPSFSFFYKDSFKFSAGFGSFTFSALPFPPQIPNPPPAGSYTQYLLSPFLQIKEQIPKTNMLVGFTGQYFYTIIKNKKIYSLNDFALFFEIGCILK